MDFHKAIEPIISKFRIDIDNNFEVGINSSFKYLIKIKHTHTHSRWSFLMLLFHYILLFKKIPLVISYRVSNSL